MQVLLSLVVGIVALNGVNSNPVTQNCGSAQCKFEESKSCVDLMTEYTFTGTCCALDPTPSGGCTVSVSAGICYYEPLVPCEGCSPGTGGKFLGSGNADGCPVTQYDALVGLPDPTYAPAVYKEVPAPTPPPVASPTVATPPTDADLAGDGEDGSDGEDGAVAAEKEPQNTSSASRMGVAAAAVASTVALLL